MRLDNCKSLIAAGFACLVACTHAGVSARCRQLEFVPFVPEGCSGADCEAIAPKSQAWECCRGGEMIGAILPYMPEVDAREIASHSNLIVEADWETRRNYGESRIAKFGRWNGLVNASVWIVDGGSGSIARYGKDKCVQMMPLPCKHPFPCQHNVSTGASQVMLPYVKSVLDELDRMGARSMVVRSGKKKLLRALGKDVDPVFSDEMHEGNERLVLEYAVWRQSAAPMRTSHAVGG